MFKDCISLSSVYNFKNLITQYLSSIYKLFYGCSSLIYIDDISNWNLDNINNDIISLIYFFVEKICFDFYLLKKYLIKFFSRDSLMEKINIIF